MIAQSVLFLAEENMDLVPDTEKKIFLKKKGLTDEMIAEAFMKFQKDRVVVTPT